MRTYKLDNRGEEPKYYYLYKELKKDILQGELRKGDKLPSKRSLAEHLGISLITVENAYLILKEEGYIHTRERSGYYVSDIYIQQALESDKQLFMLDENMNDAQVMLKDKEFIDNELVTCNFPKSLYFKTVRAVISQYGDELIRKSPNEGCAILRNSIARYLLRYRGIFAQPEQIIIGSGAEHLYGCVVRMLGNDKIYGIEDPSYSQIRKVYEGTGASCELLRMECDGISSDALAISQADVLHVTPFHSYPSGVTASVAKRYEYLNWAKEHEAYIVEDDFDSEFFMPGKPVETLFMSDKSGSVIYINTFSNSLSSSIRMGYMILPQKLLDKYRLSSGGFSCTVPVLDQYALAEFIDKGYFEQHLNRIRRKRTK